MQTFKSSNSSIELLGATNKKPTASKKDNKDSNEFLNMVLSATASRARKGESITEDDVKDIAKSINMQKESLQKVEQDANMQVAQDIASKLDESTKNELYENANFMQLLQVLEILNGEQQVSKYPNFSDKIASFLSNIANVKELSEVKNINELIDLANKFDLGLEKIKITQEDVKNLNHIFQNLGKNDFFTPVLTHAPKIMTDLKNQVETALKNQKQEPTIKLNDLLKDISKVANEQKNTQQPTINTTTNATSNQVTINLEDTVIPNEVIKKQIADDILDDVKQQPQTNINLKESKEQKINLQTLLYPQKEQETDGESLNQESKPENELNSMVRDIAKNAQSQIQNRLAVRETLSNFSSTLAEQVANYKAPITKFNITLNPLNLGEVEITMLNRGNNLHINFNSNTSTMNIFLQNQADFKNSLVNMGFTELEMNFSDQNNKKEQGQKTYKNSSQNEFFDENENNEHVMLELVIPRYI